MAGGTSFGCQNWSGGPFLVADRFFRYSPLVAISTGYIFTTNTCVVTGSQKFDNTANSSVATEMKIQVEHQRSSAQDKSDVDVIMQIVHRTKTDKNDSTLK